MAEAEEYTWPRLVVGGKAILLSVEAIKNKLDTEVVGREIVYLPVTTSTNDVAKLLAKSGRPDGTVVLAEEQTAGRGRLGRRWIAPAGTSLLFSVLLRPPIPPGRAFTLTMFAAVSVASAVERSTGLTCALKWPNDVLIGGRKLAGILSEMSLTRDALEYVIVGIGLNVNADLRVIPEIADTATSIRVELGFEVDRLNVLCCVLNEMDRWYRPLVKARREMRPDIATEQWQRAVFGEWRSRLVTLGKSVVVSNQEKQEEGVAIDVAPDGALLLSKPNGQTVLINVGDVSLRPTL